MSNINQSFLDRVRYTLFHDILGSMIINEPTGWKEDEKEYARNEEYDGIVAQFSNSLVFVGEAAEFINLIKELYGIQTDLRLTKDIRHPKTDVWENEYFGYLDMSTWTKEKKGVSVKFNSGGLQEQIKARESEEVELDRLTTMDGEVIEPMPYETVKYDGRRIFLRSSFKNVDAPDNFTSQGISGSSVSGVYDMAVSTGLPLNLISRSHEEVSSVTNQGIGSAITGSAAMMFFLQSIGIKTVKITLNITLTTNVTVVRLLNSGTYKISLTTYENGGSYTVKNRITLLEVDLLNWQTQLGGSFGGGLYPKVTHNLTYTGDFELLDLESMSIESLLDGNTGSPDSIQSGAFFIRTEDHQITMNFDEDSVFESTNSKFYLPFEAFERLIQIYTGKKGILKSKALGRLELGYPQDGPASLIGINHGFWVRGFDALPESTEENQNLFKPLATSIRNFMDSFSTVANLSMGIEKNGYSEKIVVEDKTYFYNKNVTIKLPNQAKNVKRSIALKYIYSGIEIGYDKGGDYEEAQGLDEYNGKNNFTTIITKTKNTFSKISNYRADAYGKEFCRRKPFFKYQDTDTQYDSDIFINDLKVGSGGIFKERVWQDDFETAPIGIYSPETATNLRISPFNLLLKHGWEVMAGLTKNVTNYIRYSNSTGNSAMKTKLISTGVEYAENGNIIGSELNRARYQAEYVEFDHIVDYEINKKLQGSTIINGEKVFNFYGLISFINENNQTEKGWLISVKPNKEGKWKLLKFNNNI